MNISEHPFEYGLSLSHRVRDYMELKMLVEKLGRSFGDFFTNQVIGGDTHPSYLQLSSRWGRNNQKTNQQQLRNTIGSSGSGCPMVIRVEPLIQKKCKPKNATNQLIVDL